MVKKLSALEKPVYFRLLADNRTCQSDIPLFQIHKTSTSQTELCITWENGSSSPFISVKRNKPSWTASLSPQRWRLPSLTLWRGSSITQYRSRMKAYLQRSVHRHPACSRPPNRPLRFNGDDEPAINLLSFRALFHKPVLFSPSALLSINHSLFKSLVQRSVKRDSQIYKESHDVFLRRLAYLLGLHIVYGTFLRQHNASLSEV